MTDADARLRCLELAVETLAGEETDFIEVQAVALNYFMFTATGQIHAAPPEWPEDEVPEGRRN